MYWNSVSNLGALLHFQYHSCEVIVYFSRDFSTTFIQYIQHTEVTANQLKSNRCFHCARLKSMYWNSVSTFGAHLQFQYHCCEEIVYFSRDLSTTFIQYIQHTEVMANQLKSNRCFHCARLKSMYWNSVSTFGALLQFQYHCCEEIVYFSRDFSTAFIHFTIYRSRGKPAEVKPMLTLCKNEIDVLRFSIQSWGTSSFSVPQLWSDSLLLKGF